MRAIVLLAVLAGAECFAPQVPRTTRAARSVAPRRSSAGGSVEVSEAEYLSYLMQSFSIEGSVELRRTSATGRALFAREACQKGDAVVRVPASHCLLVNGAGAVLGGLDGQTEAMFAMAGDLREPVTDDMAARGCTWDVKMALALLEVSGMKLYGQSAGLSDFWDSYCQLLPGPGELTLPLCLPACIVGEARHPRLATDGAQQRERLRSLFPQLCVSPEQESRREESFGSSFTGMAENAQPYPLAPLEWAFAAIRSRAFQLLPETSDAKEAPLLASGVFALPPVLDMANHRAAPNCNFRAEDVAVNPATGKVTGFVVLEALEDVAAGDELTISYVPTSGPVSVRRMLAQYGFIVDATDGREALFEEADAPPRLPLRAVRPAALAVLSKVHTEITNDSMGDVQDADDTVAGLERGSAGLAQLEDLDCRLQAVLSELCGDLDEAAGRDNEGEGADAGDEDVAAAVEAWREALAALEADEARGGDAPALSPVALKAAQRVVSEVHAAGAAAGDSDTVAELREMVDPRLLQMVGYRMKRRRLLETFRLVLDEL